jgi:putative PIN family toxin of toxin-antitoxin system
MKVVLDTNILASGAISTTGSLRAIVDAWRNSQFRVIVSPPIVEELEHTLQKPYFRRYLPEKLASRFLKLVQKQATVSPITVSVHGIASHPEDDVILATAVSAKADYLVTGDTKLQHVRTYKGVTILSPKQFLTILKDYLANA